MTVVPENLLPLKCCLPHFGQAVLPYWATEIETTSRRTNQACAVMVSFGLSCVVLFLS